MTSRPYLRRRDRGPQQTLSVAGVKRRPAAGVVPGLLTAGLPWGRKRIVVRDVEAHHGGPGWSAHRCRVPSAMRVVRRDAFRRSGSAMLWSGRCAPHVARDLALDVRRLLASGATYCGEPVRPATSR